MREAGFVILAKEDNAVLHYDGIEWPPPVYLRVVHHHVHENWHYEAQYRRAVRQLTSVHCAVPSRTAMDGLIAQDLKSVENKAQDAGNVTWNATAKARAEHLKRFSQSSKPAIPLWCCQNGLKT
ncbi:hypothetical protein [Mesorhizobium sp. M1322]|uniref:hypothetical protein n=1 Tax=Mesorhizobium sp. M1322 TaxID=2957081 RepID=UPI003334E042